MSSTNMINQDATVSSSILFKSNSKCLDIQSGMTVLNSNSNTGVFETNCEVSSQFNVLNMFLLPNMVSSNAYLKFKNKPNMSAVFDITIWNIEGMPIKSFTLTGLQIFDGVNINMLSIPPGGYVLTAASSQYKEALKFIKSN